MESDVQNVKSFYHSKCSINLDRRLHIRVVVKNVLKNVLFREIWKYLARKQHQRKWNNDRTYATYQKPSYHKEKRVFIDIAKTIRKMMIKVIKNRIFLSHWIKIVAYMPIIHQILNYVLYRLYQRASHKRGIIRE